MAIMELTVNQQYQNQLVINRFHFIANGTPASVNYSFALLSASGFLATNIASSVFPVPSIARQVQDVVSNSLTFLSAYARDLYSDTDFYESPYPAGITGQYAGTPASPALSYALTSNRVRSDIRRGQKRLSGVSEDAMVSGGVLDGGFMTSLGYVANEMSAVLTFDDEGNTLSFSPAVLSFEEYTTPSGRKAYRKYATAAAQLSHAAVGVLWQEQPTVRTQTSRQYGRGR
jgi:hypothetical protein